MYKLLFLILSLQVSGCTSFLASTSAASIAIAHDRRTTGTLVEDQTIRLKAKMALAEHDILEQKSNISVISYNRNVLLVGQVPNKLLKEQATRIVKKIANVKSVYNKLTIEPHVTFSRRVKDTYLTSKIKMKLIANQDVGLNRVTVVTENAKVYLMGILTKEEEETAVKLIREIPGVKTVINATEGLA